MGYFELGRAKIVEMAVKNGANINVKSDDGRTPLHYAAANGMLFQ